MIEDRLDTDQRIRLEALNQANALHTMRSNISAETVLEVASRFEAYIREGNK